MFIIELIFAPVLEFFLPLFYFLAELIFWLLLFVWKAVSALLKMQKPVWPKKPKFTKIRNKTQNISKSWKEKRKAKINNKKRN